MSNPGKSLVRLTRRQWTVLIGAAPLLAQVPPAATPDSSIQKAAAEVHANSDRLSQIDVPMDIEPAFAFKV